MTDTARTWTILGERPISPYHRRVLIDRGDKHTTRYVVATCNNHSMSHGEWYWGHYFSTLDEAAAFFEDYNRTGVIPSRKNRA